MRVRRLRKKMNEGGGNKSETTKVKARGTMTRISP
jgi:hypothetical protein